MKIEIDIERFINKPNLLIDVLREVIDKLDVGMNDTEIGAQLREISRAIESLDKKGVPIPESLRAEKTKLAAVLGTKTDSDRILNQLVEKLEEILLELKGRLGQSVSVNKSKKTFGKRSRSPKTKQMDFREPIIKALQKYGGSAKQSVVLDEVEKQLKGKLLSGDLEIRQDGKTIAWRNNAAWERNKMKDEGILRSGSPHGTWELSEEYM